MAKRKRRPAASRLTFWHWVPGKAIGPFRFGNDAQPYIHKYHLRLLEPACSIATWQTYEIPGAESRVSVEDGKIEDVNCWDAVECRGVNLLGMPMCAVRALLGPEKGQGQGVWQGYAVYYDRLGLTLFITADDTVRSATCTAPD